MVRVVLEGWTSSRMKLPDRERQVGLRIQGVPLELQGRVEEIVAQVGSGLRVLVGSGRFPTMDVRVAGPVPDQALWRIRVGD